MYEKLLNYYKHIPAEYEKGTGEFWNDEHISKQMLKAHLDPNIDSASRTHGFIKKSASWIAEIAGEGSGKTLLDLGCGPGLYATELSDLGFCVTGLDISGRSIAYAEDQAKSTGRNINYLCENYLNIDFLNEFDIAVMIYCDYGVLSQEDRMKLLLKVKRALKPGGILILDFFTENEYKDFTEGENIEYKDGGFWSSEPYLCTKRNMVYQASKTYLEQYIIITNDDCKCYNIWNQPFCKQRIKDELKRAGFGELKYFDDISGSKYSGTDTTICAVAESR